jgi:hypothetical protein
MATGAPRLTLFIWGSAVPSHNGPAIEGKARTKESTINKFAKLALSAALVAGAATATTAALSTPAEARVSIGIGIGPGYGYYGGYYGPPAYGYYDYYRPAYYPYYYGPRAYYRSGWDRPYRYGRHWRGYRHGGWHGHYR